MLGPVTDPNWNRPQTYSVTAKRNVLVGILPLQTDNGSFDGVTDFGESFFKLKYTPPDGLPSMKKAVVRYTEENYDRLVAPENVIITNGAKQSLFNIFYSILNPHDEVIVLAPYWVSYNEMIRMCTGVPVVVTPEDGTFTPRSGRDSFPSRAGRCPSSTRA